jgi:hypothetical protein
VEDAIFEGDFVELAVQARLPQHVRRLQVRGHVLGPRAQRGFFVVRDLDDFSSTRPPIASPTHHLRQRGDRRIDSSRGRPRPA